MAASVEAVAEVEVGLDVHVTLPKFESLSTWIVYCVGLPVEALHEKAGVVSLVRAPFAGDESAGTSYLFGAGGEVPVVREHGLEFGRVKLRVDVPRRRWGARFFDRTRGVEALELALQCLAIHPCYPLIFWMAAAASAPGTPVIPPPG